MKNGKSIPFINRRRPCWGANKKNGFPQQGLFVFAICGLPLGGNHGWHSF